jgi:Tol biopolymer transport system component
LFEDLDPVTGRDIWELSISRKESKPLVKTPFAEGNPVFSPRGHWIAYQQSDEPGRAEVYVQAYPGPGAKRRVSSDGGTNRSGATPAVSCSTGRPRPCFPFRSRTATIFAPDRLFVSCH